MGEKILKKANILIVDDNETNREVLKHFIIDLGHTPFLVENGESALSQMGKQLPDLVLLDILMPEMDGYEVLERIKNHQALIHLPVIMITAIDEVESAARCIEKGADDYLTKPFNQTLLKARIKNSLERKFLRDEENSKKQKLRELNAYLKDSFTDKSEELSDAKIKLGVLDNAKDGFLRLISHELKTPLYGMFGSCEIAFDEELDSKTKSEFNEIFNNSRNRLLGFIEDAILLKEIKVSGEKIQLHPNSVKKALEKAVDSVKVFAKSRQVTISKIPDCSVNVLSNDELLQKAFATLVETAVKFSNKDSEISLSCDIVDNYIIVGIRAKGLTVPEDQIDSFFEMFYSKIALVPSSDLGLRLVVADEITKLFKGSVSIQNHDSPGILLSVKLSKV